MFDLACLNHCLEELKCLRKSIKEDIIRVKWPLSLIRILQVKHVEALQIEALQRLFKLHFQEGWVHAVVGLLHDLVFWDAIFLDESLHHLAKRNLILGVLGDVTCLRCHK